MLGDPSFSSRKSGYAPEDMSRTSVCVVRISAFVICHLQRDVEQVFSVLVHNRIHRRWGEGLVGPKVYIIMDSMVEHGCYYPSKTGAHKATGYHDWQLGFDLFGDE